MILLYEVARDAVNTANRKSVVSKIVKALEKVIRCFDEDWVSCWRGPYNDKSKCIGYDSDCYDDYLKFIRSEINNLTIYAFDRWKYEQLMYKKDPSFDWESDTEKKEDDIVHVTSQLSDDKFDVDVDGDRDGFIIYIKEKT